MSLPCKALGTVTILSKQQPLLLLLFFVVCPEALRVGVEVLCFGGHFFYLFFIFRFIYVLCLHVHLHVRRHQIPSQMVVSHHVELNLGPLDEQPVVLT